MNEGHDVTSFPCQPTMTTDFPPDTNELLEAFEEMLDWEERYEYLLDLGRELPTLDPDLQQEENKVSGCMSTVWLVLEEPAGDPAEAPLSLRADSDSLIVKGLIVVLMALYQGKTPAAAIEVDPEAFLSKLGLNQHLSPNRRNGLYSMIGRVRELCVLRLA